MISPFRIGSSTICLLKVFVRRNYRVTRLQCTVNIVQSSYPRVRVPASLSYTDFVFQDAHKHEEKVALVNAESGDSISYSKLQTDVQRLCTGLSSIGFKKGDVIALFSPNIPEYVVAFHGVTSVGGILTTVNPQYTLDELTRQIKHSGAKYLLTHPTLLDKAMPAAKNVGIKTVFVFGETEIDGCQTFDSLLDNDGSLKSSESLDTKNDLLVIPYSSGTTGLPKGVMLTHDNLKFNVAQSVASPLWNFDKDSVVLGMIPLFHIYGMLFFTGLGPAIGLTSIILPKFSLETFLSCIEKFKVTTIPLVPPVAVMLAKEEIVDRYDVTSLTEIVCGAAPMGAELEEELKERFPHLKILRQAYGMTESSPITHIAPRDKSKQGSIGKPVPNTECKIVDIATGESLGVKQDGELCVRGPQVMKGYLNNPEATANTIDSDGWLHSGDIGHYDEEGYFYIVDRLKELIKYKAYQVAPAELEAVILGHHEVADTAVVGVNDPEAGELPRAFVVRHGEVTEKDIQDYVAERVAPYKKLRGGVEFVNEIPKSASGKILRRLLREKVNNS